MAPSSSRLIHVATGFCSLRCFIAFTPFRLALSTATLAPFGWDISAALLFAAAWERKGTFFNDWSWGERSSVPYYR